MGTNLFRDHDWGEWIEGRDLLPFIHGAAQARVKGRRVVFRRGDGSQELLDSISELYVGRLGQTAGIRIEVKTNSPCVLMRGCTRWVRTGDLRRNWARIRYGYAMDSGRKTWKTRHCRKRHPGCRWAISLGGEGHHYIYLPTGSCTELSGLKFVKGSWFQPVRYGLSWMAFGDSHTQGGYCSSPSLNFPALVHRRLGIDYYNCGIDGYLLDTNVPQTFDLNCDVITILAGTNCYNKQESVSVRELYVKLFSHFMQRFPEVPILVISPFFRQYVSQGRKRGVAAESCPGEFNVTHEQIREACHEAFESVKDERMEIVNGLTMVDRRDMLVDQLHANDRGMCALADGLSPMLRSLLERSVA